MAWEFFPVLFVWIRVVIHKSFLSCKVVFFLVLWLEGGGFFLDFSLSACICVSKCWLLQLHVWNICGNKKTQRIHNCHSLGPEDSSCFVFFQRLLKLSYVIHTHTYVCVYVYMYVYIYLSYVSHIYIYSRVFSCV